MLTHVHATWLSTVTSSLVCLLSAALRLSHPFCFFFSFNHFINPEASSCAFCPFLFFFFPPCDPMFWSSISILVIVVVVATSLDPFDHHIRACPVH
ncbi:unnamed protein product [Periconia digitata]|uniref:Uncharacterized protein n=1 Tax=Periconia digitata TaxID=1303443 RepID=A0A9W4U711_9PLEO|nr:unnamed protein product [Periconia digitata]